MKDKGKLNEGKIEKQVKENKEIETEEQKDRKEREKSEGCKKKRGGC